MFLNDKDHKIGCCRVQRFMNRVKLQGCDKEKRKVKSLIEFTIYRDVLIHSKVFHRHFGKYFDSFKLLWTSGFFDRFYISFENCLILNRIWIWTYYFITDFSCTYFVQFWYCLGHFFWLRTQIELLMETGKPAKIRSNIRLTGATKLTKTWKIDEFPQEKVQKKTLR